MVDKGRGLAFEPGFQSQLWESTEQGRFTPIVSVLVWLVDASGRLSVRRGCGVVLFFQRLPFRSQNSACQREFAIWSGVHAIWSGVHACEGKSLCVFSSRFRRRCGFWTTVLGKTGFTVLH
ncbi:hypothetical protein RHMOL_Rhmol10G0143800 [Rhododendron molle]|uniref:Uncharacterized protein n=1 Tax=Rhododendron molle TaxID=49168 RepID=A0ACC0M2G7_RHOML|nr:hypothetical protein RHMOL_Rhmol10G0143800 [Rhododendron molle]